MPIQELKHQIGRLPEQPGVYLFSGQGGETLYVGKARALRNRVRSYLRASGASPRLDALLEEAEALEVVVTDSVVEALALENHLIKQRMPKYNILLRDDKNYPYLTLTTSEAFPRVLVARRVERNADFFAGPFLPASLARKTMSLTHRLFGLRSCNELIDGKRGRPCLEYDIKRCSAPCVDTICTPEQYAAAVEDTRLFLEGRSDELVGALRARMLDASEADEFERAGQLRDAIRTIDTLSRREQKMSAPELGDRDVFGIKSGSSGAVVLVLQVRHGRVIERVELVADPSADADVLQAAIQQFYEARVPPPVIHVAVEIEDRADLEAWLERLASRKVRIVVPHRGDKRGLLDLATRNAALAYDHRFNHTTAAQYDALETLREVLALPSLPRRIECFDVSTIQGRDTVASLVVCEDGRTKRGEYRKFKIRGEGRGARDAGHEGRLDDDFAAMEEVVGRRYRRIMEHGGPFPDLIVIDGGKGQLRAAYSALESLGLANLVAIGLAKKEELIFTRDQAEPIAFPTESPALRLLQRIRDEAHRFAVTFHRSRRRARDLTSALDQVPGIGAKRRRTLLSTFGGLAGVRRASRADLAAVVGAKTADAVIAYFSSR